MATLNLVVKTRTGVAITFVDAAVTSGSDLIALPGHGLATGDIVRLSNSGGALPAGLVATKVYYVIKISEGTIKLATTAANAAAGTPVVDITAAAGGGTHTLKVQESGFKDLTQVASADAKQFAKGIANFFHGLSGGSVSAASVDVSEDCDSPVAATATITLTHANIDDADTVTIGGTVITAKTSATVDSTQWTIGADETADAAAMAATINKNLTLSRIMTATSALGVVTLTMKVKGVIGNSIVMSTSDATAFALVAFSGGTGGACNTVSTYSFGL